MPVRVGLLIVRSISSRPAARAALRACENALARSCRGTREENIGHYLIMSALTIGLDELLRYTAGERDKWRLWLSLHPDAMDAPVQPGGRLPTVGKLVDHIFLVEQRHLQRLTRQPLSSSTGLTGSNVAPLFNYGASVRRELRTVHRRSGPGRRRRNPLVRGA